MATYRAFIEMTFEPDENGYLEWENYDPEFDEPRTEEQMKEFFAEELWEWFRNGIEFDAIYVEKEDK